MWWWVSKPKLYHSGYIVGMTLAGMSYKYKAPFGMVCSNDGGCRCQLRILRAVSTLYSVLKTLLNYVYTARRSHLGFVSIDKALGAGDFHSLMQNTRLTGISEKSTMFCHPMTRKALYRDPISRKFSCFFHNITVKGDHFYWKKEYQTRGSPHYQVLLWIWNASVIGQDKPGEILAWLQARITCRIPNEKSDANLHRLITRYQM